MASPLTSYSKGGFQYFYSDSPEEYYPAALGVLAQTTIAAGSNTLDLEYYHFVWADSSQRVGIALQNPGSTAVNISYRRAATNFVIGTGASTAACRDMRIAFETAVLFHPLLYRLVPPSFCSWTRLLQEKTV